MFGCSAITRGNPTHRSLIFLHGLFGCSGDWEPILDSLSPHYYCTALDLPGHGKTPYREEILNSFREHLQKSPVKPILIGYSMGGRIALQLREEAQGVIAISSHLGLKKTQEKQSQLEKEEEWKTKLLTLPPSVFFKQWYEQPLFASLSESPSLLKALIEKRKCQDPVILAQVLSQLSVTRQEHITSFPNPTLLIHGKKDSKYQQLYHNIPIPVCSIENAGHACLIENPQECGLTILNWLETYADNQ